MKHLLKCSTFLYVTESLTTVGKCAGKSDGNYTMQDVFKYRECKGGKETIKSCEITKNEICVAQQGGKCSCQAVTEKKDKGKAQPGLTSFRHSKTCDYTILSGEICKIPPKVRYFRSFSSSGH